MKTIKLNIKGKVQGVFYRQSTRSKASQLGLRGWVRNMPDGSVEGLASGKAEALESLIRWCHQGPPAARVDSVQVQWLDETPEDCSERFEIR